jgi:hypothetical protein
MFSTKKGNTKEELTIAYNQQAIILFGEYARLNEL